MITKIYKFGFYCYLNEYDIFPTLYHFEPDIYTYDEICSGKYPKVCYTYLDIFNFNRWHINSELDSILEWDDCKIDETTNIFVDIGANSGFASYYAYLKGAKNIFSFEPSMSENRSFLLNNIPNTTLYSMALSDTVGFKLMDTVWDKNNKYVFCVTLDYLFEQNIFQNINFLKIDVEGHEYQVFKGLSDDNLMKIKNISLELHGSNRKNDPTMGEVFINDLQNRLWNIPYFDGTSYRKRYTLLLHRGEADKYLYSKII